MIQTAEKSNTGIIEPSVKKISNAGIKEKLNLDITKHPASEKKVPHRHPERIRIRASHKRTEIIESFFIPRDIYIPISLIRFITRIFHVLPIPMTIIAIRIKIIKKVTECIAMIRKFTS